MGLNEKAKKKKNSTYVLEKEERVKLKSTNKASSMTKNTDKKSRLLMSLGTRVTMKLCRENHQVKSKSGRA